MRNSPEGVFCVDKVPVKSGEVDIIDYNGDDYRGYWHGAGRRIVNRIETDVVARLCRPSSGWFVDLGCGYGRLFPCYASKAEHFVLVDYALNNLRLAAARTRHCANVHFVAADAYRLPFRPGAFNVGVCVRLFHHILDPARFLREVGRIMAADSAVTMSYVNTRNLPRLLRSGMKAVRGGHRKLSSMMYGTSPSEFRRLTRGCGFSTVEVLGTGFIDQILNKPAAGRRLEAVVDASAIAGKALALAEVAADRAFGPVQFAPHQFIRMRKSIDGGRTTPALPPRTLLDILQCVACGGSLTKKNGPDLHCTMCGATYPSREGIYDFRPAGSPATT